jgi:hypothetical protein
VEVGKKASISLFMTFSLWLIYTLLMNLNSSSLLGTSIANWIIRILKKEMESLSKIEGKIATFFFDERCDIKNKIKSHQVRNSLSSDENERKKVWMENEQIKCYGQDD